MITFATYPGKTIVKLSGPQPRTAREAKKFAQHANESARKKREAKEQQHQARQRELDALIEKNRAAAGSLACTRGPRLDPSAVYRARAEAAQPPQAKATTPAPRRPRSLGDVARDYYGGGDQGGELIAARPRGGAR